MDNQLEDKSITPNWENVDTIPEVVGGGDHHFHQLKNNEEMHDSR